jgi:hypothetical protein
MLLRLNNDQINNSENLMYSQLSILNSQFSLLYEP